MNVSPKLPSYLRSSQTTSGASSSGSRGPNESELKDRAHSIWEHYDINGRDEYFWMMAKMQAAGDVSGLALRHLGLCLLKRGYDIPQENWMPSPGSLRLYLGGKSEQYNIPHPLSAPKLADLRIVGDRVQIVGEIFATMVSETDRPSVLTKYLYLGDENFVDRADEILTHLIEQRKITYEVVAQDS